jgi:hypothetical protein
MVNVNLTRIVDALCALRATLTRDLIGHGIKPFDDAISFKCAFLSAALAARDASSPYKRPCSELFLMPLLGELGEL